jgi:alpha-aminoadipic semialdehyde synthase
VRISVQYIGNAHNYSSSSAARAAVNQLGREIQLGLLPESLGRIVFTFTGRGNVAQGAQNVFQELPNEYVSPSELQEVVESGDMRKVYGTVVSKEDYLEHIDGKKFDPTEFKAHPERYRSVFAEKIAPYTTVLVNGIYWEPGYPRLLTLDDMRRIQPRDYNVDFSIGVPDLPQKLLAICDISADIKGSVEFLRDYTTIDAPFMMYNAHTDEETYGEVQGNGVLLHSIDHLPAQLPRESTDYFGSRLMPFMKEIVKLDGSHKWRELDGLSDTVKNSIMTYDQQLTPKFKYISELRRQLEEDEARLKQDL